jgi:hypothetical protein
VASVAGEKPSSTVVRAAATATETSIPRRGIAGGEVRSRWMNINDWNLLFQAHLMSEEVTVEFINGQGIDYGCDRRNKWIIF